MFCGASQKKIGKLINKVISQHYQYHEEESRGDSGGRVMGWVIGREGLCEEGCPS